MGRGSTLYLLPTIRDDTKESTRVNLLGIEWTNKENTKELTLQDSDSLTTSSLIGWQVGHLPAC